MTREDLGAKWLVCGVAILASVLENKADAGVLFCVIETFLEHDGGGWNTVANNDSMAHSHPHKSRDDEQGGAWLPYIIAFPASPTFRSTFISSNDHHQYDPY